MGARVRVDGLKARPELNGSLATADSFNSETGRWNVMVDDWREPLALKLEALSVAEEFAGFIVGTRVRIAGLDKRDELNGKLGTVRGFAGERCSVYVEAVKETVALTRDKLAVAEEAPSGQDAPTERKVRVECNGVMLKLTLNERTMRKPFADAVVRPFLKAYASKKGLAAPPELKDVAQVTVDSEGQTQLQVLNDITIFSAEQCLEKLRGEVDVDIHLKDPDAVPKAPERKPKREVMSKDTRVVIQGLSSQKGAELNGQEGHLSAYHEASGRYDVTLRDGQVVSVKEANLIDIGQHML